MIGSSRIGFACLHRVLKPIEPAILKAISEESTVWYEPSKSSPARRSSRSRRAALSGSTSRMPFSTAGMNWRGMTPPTMPSTNSKPVPRGSGETPTQESPNWPRPPVCFFTRPCALAVPLMVSLYGTFGALSSTSTPNLRLSFSTATSMCSWPTPERMISLVCASRCIFRVGSSSISLCRPRVAFSSSPFDLGSMANEIAADTGTRPA